MTKFRKALSAILLFASAFYWSGPAWPQAPVHQFARTVPRDQETMLRTHDNYKHQGTVCVSNGIPTLAIVTPPQHGTLRFGPAQVTNPTCANSYEGVGVFYRPNPGFIGHDEVTYNKPPQGGNMTVQNEGTIVIDITVQ